MKFLNIKIEGFRTWHNVSFLLDRPGLTQIGGKTGSGKSSLIEALVWCLYGETLRGGNGSNVATKKTQRPLNWSGTSVIVDLILSNGDNLTVARYLDSNKTGMVGHKSALILTLNGDLLPVDNKRETQKELEALLGLSFNAFSKAVVLPQRALSLLNAKPEHQREAIDALFDLKWLTQAKAKALADVQLYTREVQEIKNSISIIKTQIASHELHLQTTIHNNNNLIQEKQNKIDKVSAQINEVKESLQSIKLKDLIEVDTALLEKLKLEKIRLEEKIRLVDEKTITCSSEKNKLHDTLIPLESKRQYNRAHKGIALTQKEKITDNCTECGQALNKEEVKEIRDRVNKKLDDLESEHLLIRADMDVIKKEIEKIDDTLFNLMDSKSFIKKEQDQLNQHIKAIESAQVELDSILAFNASFETLYKDQEKRLLNYEVQLSTIKSSEVVLQSTNNLELDINNLKQQLNLEEENLKTKQGLYEIASYWSVFGFGGRGGIREYVVNSMLESANEQIKKYSGTLGLTLNIVYDKTSIKVTVIDQDGFQSNFEDLSGGEQQRLELMLTLTLHDIINVNSGIDLLFLDEPITNVDDEGVFEVFEILRQKTGNIFIITHTAVDGVGLNIIPVEKINNESKILI